MKYTTKNATNTNESILRGNNVSRDENRLYNLLFAGRITLKEYLKEAKRGERQNLAV